MKKSIFIKALIYAGDHPDGFTIDELQEHLGTSEFGPLRNEFTGQKYRDNLFYQAGSIKGKDRYWLTGLGHQRLFEINEIQEASANAKSARIISLISIIAAIIIPITIAIIWPSN
jgi:hypothetical protein